MLGNISERETMKNFSKIILSILVIFSLIQPAFCTVSSTSKNDLIKKTEQRLSLTEKQRTKTQLIYKKALEQIKPLQIQLEQKKQKLNSFDSLTQENEDEILLYKKEIKDLNKQINHIRKDASKNFEKLLTRSQKKELKKMQLENMKNSGKNF